MFFEGKYRRWRALSSTQRGLLAEAAFFLGMARVLLVCVPFRWVVPRLQGLQGGEGAEPQLQMRIGKSVASAARHVPWKALCLVQAMAAKWMLGRRGYGSTLHLGVGRKEQGEMMAHAWLEAGGAIVIGGESRELVVPIAHFD